MKQTKTIALLLGLVVLFSACESRGEDFSSSSSDTTSSTSVPPSSSTSQPSSSTPSSYVPDSSSVEPSAPPTGPTKPTISLGMEEITQLDNKAVLWGPGTHKDGDGRPIACVDLQKKYEQYDADFIGACEKKVYLTFDEGYEAGFTAPILDALKEKNATAVFFVTMEYVKSQPDLVQRMIDEGHIIGNHSAGHPDYTQSSLEKQTEATIKLHDYMMENYDYEMVLFRYPAGTFTEQSLALLQSLGYKSSFWSFAYADWDVNKQMSQEDALNKVKGGLHDGAIFLLHAVSKTNADILGEVIDYIRDQGYEIAHYDL